MSAVCFFLLKRSRLWYNQRRFGIVLSAAQIIYEGFCFVLSITGEFFAPSRIVYGVALAVCAVTLLCLLFLVPRAPGLKRPMMYFVMLTLLGAGVWMSLLQLQANARTAILFASVLIVPIMFISDTLPTAALLLADVIAFFVFVGPRIDAGSFEWASINLVIFATGGILIGHFVNKARAERYVFAGFEDVGTVYRLGGDEFSVIMTGTAEDAKVCLRRTEELCAGWKGRIIEGISISYGVASSEEYSDIASLTKAADERMCAFKQNYYLTSGKERRRR